MKTYLLSLIFISFGITFFGVNADHTRWQIDAGTINRLVIFGDDYSDMYNLYNATLQTFPSPIDFDGFVGPVCNGPLWWKYMLDAYINKYNDLQYFIPDGQVMNFAYIFAGLNATARPWASQTQTGIPVPDVNQQVQIYLGTLAATGAPPVPNTLHIIFAGINELTHVNPPGSTPPFAAYASELLHAGITILTSPLVGENSQVLYVSLIPQGSSPYITANFPAGTGALLDSAVNVFNGILRQTILAYKYMPNGFPGLEWVDVTAEWARMSAKPAQYGMSLTGGPKNNPVGFCANYVPGTPSSEHCADVNDYYWWNPIWTSAVTHRWLGKRVFLEAFKQGEDEFQTSYY